jgi:hypothetical protein
MEASQRRSDGKEFHTVGATKEKDRRACSFLLMGHVSGGYWMSEDFENDFQK